MEIILLGIAAALIGIYLHRYYKLSKRSLVHGMFEASENENVEEDVPRKPVQSTLTEPGPQSSEAKLLYSKAMIFYKRGELEETKKRLIQATALDENFLDANSKLGIIYLKQEQFGKAEAIFKQLISKSGGSAVYLSNLGRALYGQNKLEEALSSYKRAIELDSSRPGRYISAGQILRQLGDREKALEMYQKASELDPDNIDYLFVLTDFLLEENRSVQAKFYLDRILKLQPDNQTALELLNKIEQG